MGQLGTCAQSPTTSPMPPPTTAPPRPDVVNTNRDAVGSVKSWCNECGWGNHITENHQIAVAAKERKFSGDFDPSRLVCDACGTVGHCWKVCDQYEQNKLRCATSLAIKENRRTAKDKRIEQMNAMMKEHTAVASQILCVGVHRGGSVRGAGHRRDVPERPALRSAHSSQAVLR